MPSNNTKTVVDGLLAAFKMGDMSTIAEYYAPEYVNRTAFPGASEGFDGHAAFFMAAAPYLDFLSNETVDVIVSGESASILSKTRYRIKETSEEFEVFGFAMIKVKDGLIVENWGGYDPIGAFKMFEAGVNMSGSETS
ncbi:MAG: nuclear transport factor 2 family protein [Pseudomonadota bacterium]